MAHKSRHARFAVGMLSATVKPPKRFDSKVIGARIAAARKAKGWSTEVLAARVHLSADALYKKQRGAAPFFFDELSRICDELGAPRLFPFLEWSEALLVERLLRDTLPHP
jgi:transcriptional regulator with XRE-family HTH domain